VNTPTRTRRRSILRAFSLTSPRLERCQKLHVNSTGTGVEVCTRFATAQQELVAATGVGTRFTFRCGTHRIPAGDPALVFTQIRTEGFARSQSLVGRTTA
jgi:hypothetical protein